MMDNKYIKQWLTEYKSLNKSDITAFAKNILVDNNIVSALWHSIERGDQENLSPVYSQLFEFYKTGLIELKRFALQFLPVVIWHYLQKPKGRKINGQIESFLLGVFNLEAIEEDGNSKKESFTVPTLAKPSVYHEPSMQLAIPDNILLHQESEHRIVSRAPLPQIDTIRSQNRFIVMTELLRFYNADLGFYHPVALQNFCAVCTKIALSGVPVTNTVKPIHLTNGHMVNGDLKLQLSTATTRVQVNPEFLAELLNGVYYVMFNGHATSGTKALDAIHCRATYEMFPEVLLVTNAIKHSLDTNPSGRPTDGPVGINISVTPASPDLKKAAITNASYKSTKTKENITTIIVTIEGVEPNMDQTDHVYLPKTSEYMHRLAVTNHARMKNKGNGTSNGTEKKGSSSDAKEKVTKSSQSKNNPQSVTVKSHIRPVHSKVDYTTTDGSTQMSLSVGGNNEIRARDSKSGLNVHTTETDL